MKDYYCLISMVVNSSFRLLNRLGYRNDDVHSLIDYDVLNVNVAHRVGKVTCLSTVWEKIHMDTF